MAARHNLKWVKILINFTEQDKGYYVSDNLILNVSAMGHINASLLVWVFVITVFILEQY